MISRFRFKETQLDGLREQYSELKDSFQYNLQLLAERDKELGSFDTSKITGHLAFHLL